MTCFLLSQMAVLLAVLTCVVETENWTYLLCQIVGSFYWWRNFEFEMNRVFIYLLLLILFGQVVLGDVFAYFCLTISFIQFSHAQTACCKSQYGNKPFDIGDSRSRCTLAPPALSPKMVTFPGSPPNCAMFCWTQRRAITWSFRPLLPGITASPVLRNPEQ